MEVMEPVGVALPGAAENNTAQLQSCDWKDCKKHTSNITYKNDGTVSRNGGYSTDWVSAKLEPWEKYGPGTDSKATLKDYQSEVSATYAVNASQLKHPEYHTQKHHLISVKLFAAVSKLSHNAKLVSYDVNAKENGVCLPSFVVDIVRHDLQCHRGNHPNNLYYDKIDPLLAELEVKCLEFCALDASCSTEPQKKLVERLNSLSKRIESQLRSWKWLLRSDAVAERVTSRALLKARQANP